MDAKEAIRYFSNIVEMANLNLPGDRMFEPHRLAIDALEKVETLEAENARLRESSDKWTDLMNKAGAVGLTEADFFKMVETIKEVMLGPKDGISCKGVCKG